MGTQQPPQHAIILRIHQLGRASKGGLYIGAMGYERLMMVDD